MAKFVNDPANFVTEMLEGLVRANPDTLEWDREYNIISAAGAANADRVRIVQGSGSGHEPAHVMAVGPGMLDAAVPGGVFAAPSMDQCLAGIRAMNGPKGVLYLVNNYQGDRMNWDMAQEMAEAEGIRVGKVVINDDVAVQDSTHTVGRRGVAGNFFVIKACGAASANGADLDTLVALGEKVNDNVRSMGVALSGCRPPAKQDPIFTLGENEVEFGVGIHGEPGRARIAMKSADELMTDVFELVAGDLPFNKGDRVALMVNGLGGTPISELYVLYRKAAELAEERGLTVVRNYVGEYCTALEMNGFSLTMLRLDDELEGLLDAPAQVPIRVF
ncbi:dihydroxyacetone kinase subunit DhaK [Aurantiacibacter gangjinensis]|uniref:Dihydroxyacetone kinase n=1 Tax=Aurantiacibacter gangjinensis TaxID=502682 RepID=A0A0G9MKU7_9SPHN|nr:dihydroxyacetone kinase subunit DhaK [Aurantiacibacter gangjinensis]APE27169.1 Phosphoenolpyruvate-dihydroxyacetone phosphotransferase, dihydroxyacetone binding subunit DhaK [Aurantiacibacter gangjinensis]KLE31307.1 dihydroxyacetone kinase [Aurantiacibacter gangjinensis]